MSLNIGDKIPDFSLVNYDKETFKSEDFLGKKTMFVFMPFPFSSVCDGEICELRDNMDAFKSADTDTVNDYCCSRPNKQSLGKTLQHRFPNLGRLLATW